MPHTKKIIDAETSRIIEMAWEDQISFEAINREYNLDESAVIRLMRNELKLSSFKLWRKRVTGRKSKHLELKKAQHGAFLSEIDIID